ncbi:RNA-guided endonuclease TnpB family protein [Microcoleus sp. T3_A4]|uniref:RNA-guided endonuclease TnpB family protein n=1 Tax=Microcoleus sp. T3_A4 TaxID=2818968 RepID=UPI002FD085AD
MLHKAIQVRLYPTQNKQIQVASTFGGARWWSNYGQNQSIEVYKKTGKGLGYSGLNTLLPVIKKSDESVGLCQYYSQFGQATTLKLTTAYQKKIDEVAGFYNFPSQAKKLLFQHPKSVNFVGTLILDYRGRTKTKKIKRYRLTDGKIQTSIISKKYSEKYLASILTEIKAENQRTKEGRIAGSDLVLKYFAIVPDDEKVSKYDNAKHFAKHQKNLKRKQPKFTGHQKKSNSEYKYRKAVAKVCEGFRNGWQDFLHKLSYKLVSDRLAVIVENFHFWNRIRNSNLAKARSDEVLGSFTNFLAYNWERKGGNLVEIDRGVSSSKPCSNCFHQMTEMPLDMREWTCPHCATDRDREGNAPIKMKAEAIKTLKAEGSAVSALGCEVRPKVGRKSQLRHSPMSTEAPTIFGTTI